jgi:molybdopterin-guanine dinucleotide biosynthesis protein A
MVTGIVLCGGQARRMGGVEKPLQLLDGVPLVALVRERLMPQVARVIISANRAHEAYAAWGDLVVADAETALGPLGGLAATLPLVTTPWFFCCPGDAPFLDRALVARLADVLGNAPCAIPSDGERPQHLFLLGQTTLLVALRGYLAAGSRSVHGFVAAQQPALLEAADIADAFRNINTPADLSAAATAPR